MVNLGPFVPAAFTRAYDDCARALRELDEADRDGVLDALLDTFGHAEAHSIAVEAIADMIKHKAALVRHLSQDRDNLLARLDTVRSHARGGLESPTQEDYYAALLAIEKDADA